MILHTLTLFNIDLNCLNWVDSAASRWSQQSSRIVLHNPKIQVTKKTPDLLHRTLSAATAKPVGASIKTTQFRQEVNLMSSTNPGVKQTDSNWSPKPPLCHSIQLTRVLCYHPRKQLSRAHRFLKTDVIVWFSAEHQFSVIVQRPDISILQTVKVWATYRNISKM